MGPVTPSQHSPVLPTIDQTMELTTLDAMGMAPGEGQHRPPSHMLEISRTDEKLAGMLWNPTATTNKIDCETQEAIELIAPISRGCSQQRKQTPTVS